MGGQNPYHTYVSSLAAMVQEGKRFPLGGFPMPANPMTALSFHVEEVRRNPYHPLVHPWMQDNVRRGGNVGGGQGGAAPDFMFATIDRLREWTDGALHYRYQGGRVLEAGTNPATLFA